MKNSKVRQFKLDKKKHGSKYAIKRFLVFIRSQLKLILYYFGRYGVWKILIWSTPIIGTVFLLSELENKSHRDTELSNLSKFTVDRLFEYKQRLEALELES